MSSIEQTRIRFDIGRVLMAPLCLLLILISLNTAYSTYNTPAPLDAFKLLSLSNSLLGTCFYVLMIAAYLLRGPARMTSPSRLAKVIAVAATFFPFSLILFQHRQQSDFRLLFLGSVLLMMGLAVSLWSLAVLGKNLSIIPQARKLVDTGPYRYVRHPLYVGEILSALGIVVSGFTLPGMLVPLILASLQAYRAIQEEKTLAAAFVEYKAYMSRTHRFIPYIL